jgi:hypothetical protein
VYVEKILLVSIENLEPILRPPFTYNASAVKIFNATSSLVRFENKNIFSTFKTAVAYYNAGVVCSCKFKTRRVGSWLLVVL